MIDINASISALRESLYSYVPADYLIFFSILFYIMIITAYAVFIWKFHKFISKKDILELNLSRYNTSDHYVRKKIFAVLFFLLEYIIILPFLILFWFVVLAIFMLLLSNNQGIGQILAISAAIIGAIRFTAYYSEDLSKELAKLFPLTLLVIFVATPELFSVSDVVGKLYELPSLLQPIFAYLAVLFLIEVVLRGVSLIFRIARDD